MATQAQINANRANAQKSTGPKTPEGKAESCLNNLSHGFCSATRFLSVEEQQEFGGLLFSLLDEHQPATPTEQILVEKMVHNHVNSLRAIRLITDALHHRSGRAGEIPKDLGLLIRYQTAADRAFHKAHAELLKAQKERLKSEIGFESQNDEEVVPAPAKPLQEPAVTRQNPVPEAPTITPTAPHFTPDVQEMAVGAEKVSDRYPVAA